MPADPLNTDVADALNTVDAEMVTTLHHYVCSGYNALYIPTSEESRLERVLAAVAAHNDAILICWDCHQGFTCPQLLPQDIPEAAGVLRDPTKYSNPRTALGAALDRNLWTWIRTEPDDAAVLATAQRTEAEQAAQYNRAPRPITSADRVAAKNLLMRRREARAVLHFRDLDDFYMADAVVRRILRTICEENRLNNTGSPQTDHIPDFRPLILSSPLRGLHGKLHGHIAVVEFPLPDEAYLGQVLDALARTAAADPEAPVPLPTSQMRDTLVQNCLGLTAQEAENCLARCISKHGAFGPAALQTVKHDKADIIKKTDVLTYIPDCETDPKAELGGYDHFFHWLDQRRAAYLPAAQELHIDNPKGVVLMGPPGTGKSRMAKAVATYLGLPGYVLDMGAVFGSLVGESEGRLRNALKQIEAQRGSVLLIDEADKSIGGAHESSGDSGVTRRVFGYLLTWLAEKQDKTFVILTLNRATSLAAELTRAGRFDALFWTDLPSVEERRQILEIHFRKRHVDLAQLGFSDADWTSILNQTDKFVGAELEQGIRDARYASWAARQSGYPTVTEMCQALSQIRPVAVRNHEDVKAIREYCAACATPVNKHVAPTVGVTAAPAAPRARSRHVQPQQAPGLNN